MHDLSLFRGVAPTIHVHVPCAANEWSRPAPSAAEEWPPPERRWAHEMVRSRWHPRARTMPGQRVHQDVPRSPTGTNHHAR
jgi:hypothetical protein